MIICGEPTVSWASARKFTYYLHFHHHNNPQEGTLYYQHSQEDEPKPHSGSKACLWSADSKTQVL